MLRLKTLAVVLVLAVSFLPLQAATGPQSIETYFTGKQVVVKLDMPGTQKGVDLRFNKATPMDWKEYSGRLKQNGAAIRKGDTVRVTSVVVKKDTIEFQLDGGGFGTFGDDTSTTVTPKVAEKSSYEKQLERDIANTDDPDRKRDLQRDLDRERARRQRDDAANQRAAQIASQQKAVQVADKRLQGGSRFNLRWQGSIPQDQLTPDAIMKLLADYIDFSGLQGGAATAATTAPNNAPSADAGNTEAPGSPTAQLKRGMTIQDVSNLLGQGRQLSESVSTDGLKTQVFEYLPGDRQVQVTYVDGLVIRFSISSR